ncbi:MAG: hypothetical protein H7318_00020 [Oligoflexus sp.]|nr:hypothetical protein [Oligoflexus sp.]
MLVFTRLRLLILGTTTISGVNLIRTGGRFWNLDHGALKIDAEGGGNLENILVENVDISDSTASGIHFPGAGKFNNIKLKNIKVTGSGTQAIWVTVEASNGKVNFENVTVEKSAKEALNNGTMMNAFMEKAVGYVGW